VLVGDKILLFGGSAHTSSHVTALCLRTHTFSAPFLGCTGGDMPCRRFTHLAALVGTRMLVGFGWTFGGARERRGCLGDFWTLDMAPANPHGCVPQPPAGAVSEIDMDPDDEEDDEDDDDDGGYAAEFNAHLAAFGQAAFADGPDGSEDEAEAEEYVAAAAQLAARFAQEGEDEDEGGAEEVQMERTLVHAIVLAVNAEDGVAVRLLMRRLQQLREMRHALAEDDDEL
jgi:hypothetical protein